MNWRDGRWGAPNPVRTLLYELLQFRSSRGNGFGVWDHLTCDKPGTLNTRRLRTVFTSKGGRTPGSNTTRNTTVPPVPLWGAHTHTSGGFPLHIVEGSRNGVFRPRSTGSFVWRNFLETSVSLKWSHPLFLQAQDQILRPSFPVTLTEVVYSCKMKKGVGEESRSSRRLYTLRS